MADFALPTAASISDTKRNALPAVRRTVISGNTSQNEYGEGEYVYVPIASGTAGAFWDCRTSRIHMTIITFNKNYFVDFINLPRCGFHTIIEELGVEVNNSLHDNNRFHAESIEMQMIRNGENMVPFEMVVSNTHEVGGGNAGELHINLVKPSMVTPTGLPHGVQYAVLQQPAGSTVSASVANTITEGLLLNHHPYLRKPMGRNGFGHIAQVGIRDNTGTVQYTGGYVGISDTSTASLNEEFAWWAETTLPSASTYDDRIHKQSRVEYKIKQGGTAGNGTFGAASTDTVKSTYEAIPTANFNSVTGGTSYNHDTQVLATNRFYGTHSKGGRYSKIYPRIDAYGSQYSDNSIFDVDYGQTVGGYTPGMWPAKQPCNIQKLKKERQEALRGVNTKNIHDYYANCKNISVAIPVNLSSDPYGKTAIWGGDEIKALPVKNDTRGHMYRFRVSLRFYSCLFGEYQQKWWPSLLFGEGRIRLRMKLQRASVAFQTLMDPCRRVPHTARDWMPYQGVFETANHMSSLTLDPINSVAHAIHPILISDYVPGAVFNDMVCTGRFPVPQQLTKLMNKPLDFFTTRSRRLCLDETIDSLENRTEDVFGGSFKTTGGVDIDKNQHCYLSLAAPQELPTTVDTSGYYPQIKGTVELTESDGDGAHLTEAQDDRVYNSIRFQGVYTVLRDILHELSTNSYFGYPTNPLRNGTTNIQLDSNLTDPGINTLLAINKAKTQLTTDPIYQFQNYHHNTDFVNFFTDRGRQTTVSPYVGADGIKYSAGDYKTEQALWHPSQATVATNQLGMFADYRAGGLNWEIFNYPVPQYVHMSTPWNKRGARTFLAEDFYSEEQGCFGTFLPASVAQVRRTHRNLYSFGSDSTYYPGVTERFTYRVSDISFVVEEIILPESASLQIVASAMQGGITMETHAIKTVEQILQRQDLQKQLINVSAGIVDDICFGFQPTEIFQGDKAYGYNSYAFYNPYTSFRFMLQKVGTKDSTNGATIIPPPTIEDDYNWLGGEPQYYNSLSHEPHLGINTMLSIATEFFPRVPIDDVHTLIEQVTWGDQRRGDVEYLKIEPMFQNTYDASNFQQIVPFNDGFWSVFTPIEALDDQTITDNPYWTPLECNLQKRIRGVRANNPALPFFKPLEGTFHLSFNLQAYMGQQDRLNVGVPMVNNNSYLQMQGAHMLREWETRMLVFIRCFARIVIERGGILQIFT